MTRIVTVGAAQMGPIMRADTRAQTVERLLILLRQAQRAGCDLVVFPEAALCSFFAHWDVQDKRELDGYFETAMPGPATQPLFDEAARLSIGFVLGYAELVRADGRERYFNTAVMVDRDGRIVGKYRKAHLPGVDHVVPEHPFQNLEKRYFAVGDLGFPTWDAFGGRVGMLICNDRRWPEAFRLLGLQGVELVALGYNTPRHIPSLPESDHLAEWHNTLCLQAGAYHNATWVVGVAKAGLEENCDMIGGSAIVAPSGELVAQACTLGDELLIAACDLDFAKAYRDARWDFDRNRRPELYGAIAAPVAQARPDATE